MNAALSTAAGHGRRPAVVLPPDERHAACRSLHPGAGAQVHLVTREDHIMPRRTATAKDRKHGPNLLDAAGITYIDYKDTGLLRRFISDRGKIRSRRVTRLSPRQQRKMARAIKNAREMALLPYSSRPGL